MHRFLIIIEKASYGNYSAYSPDLPGCIATGATRREVKRNMYEAIEIHLQGLLEDGVDVPEPNSFADYVVIG
jgi:predicted RNase H-like HicB family nuclease